MTAALLVIDVQQALCAGDYAAHDAPALIARINAVIGKARAARLPVVFIQHEESGGPLAPGTTGWQLAAGLQAQADDLRLRKTASDAFHATPLQALLQARAVRRLVVCGLQTEYCVDTTVRRALALGYPVTLVADGHSTLDNGILPAPQIVAHHNRTLANLTSFGPRVTLQTAEGLQVDA